MKNILVVKSSILGGNSNSSALIDQQLARLQEKYPDAQVAVRDLGAQPIPHLDGERVAAFFTPAEQRSAEQQEIDDFSLALIEELKAADQVIVGLPMYNFGVPSQFKSWFDHVARAGISFRYTETGPQGLLADRPVTVVAARGGLYVGTENDTVTPFIKLIFSFLGISDIRFVYAEGVNLGEQQKAEAIAEADKQLQAQVA